MMTVAGQRFDNRSYCLLTTDVDQIVRIINRALDSPVMNWVDEYGKVKVAQLYEWVCDELTIQRLFVEIDDSLVKGAVDKLIHLVCNERGMQT